MSKPRLCEVCRESQAKRKVWAKHNAKVIKVICMTCGQSFAFWLDGTVYDKRIGPSDEQKKVLEFANKYWEQQQRKG